MYTLVGGSSVLNLTTASKGSLICSVFSVSKGNLSDVYF